MSPSTVLERVAVNDGDQPFLVDQRHRFIDIADDGTQFIDARQRTRKIQGDADEEPEIDGRKFGLSVARRAELVQRLDADSLTHREADECPFGGHSLNRKRNERRALIQFVSDHRVYFIAPLCRLAIHIELGGEGAVPFDLENLSLASFPKPVA